jgi:hypothetical protein
MSVGFVDFLTTMAAYQSGASNAAPVSSRLRLGALLVALIFGYAAAYQSSVLKSFFRPLSLVFGAVAALSCFAVVRPSWPPFWFIAAPSM